MIGGGGYIDYLRAAGDVRWGGQKYATAIAGAASSGAADQ